MLVGKRMSPNPVTVDPATPVTDARKIMQREKIHRLPVVDRHGKLIGIVTEKDLLYASPSPVSSLDIYEVSHLLSKLTVDRVMTKRLVTVTADTPIEDAARIMIDNNIGGVPVMKDDLMIGIITESDLLKIFIELFGARQQGIRATILIPERPGALAEVAQAIRDRGGDIISLGTFLGEDPSNAYCTFKVQDLTKEELAACLAPHVEKISDIRET